MNRIEEILNYANSLKGKGIESEELKEVIRLAIIDGATWADANPKWKPSDEQMEALLYEVNALDEDSANGQNLKSLYQDLKKL